MTSCFCCFLATSCALLASLTWQTTRVCYWNYTFTPTQSFDDVFCVNRNAVSIWYHTKKNDVRDECSYYLLPLCFSSTIVVVAQPESVTTIVIPAWVMVF